VKSKVRVSAGGRRSGGTPYSRGALYQILKSRIYLGEVPHRDQSYKGEHESIVPLELWQQVQARLRSDHQGRRNGIRANSPSLLTGLLQDPQGTRFTPSHTLKNKKRYRYYVCQSKRTASPKPGPSRVPAYQVESLVLSRLQSFLISDNDLIDELRLSEMSVSVIKQVAAAAREASSHWLEGDPNQVRRVLNHLIDRITIQPDSVEIFVVRQRLREAMLKGLETVPVKFTRSKRKQPPDDVLCLTIEARFNRSSGETRLLVAPRPGGRSFSRPRIIIIEGSRA
jgi:site-specific DNA recombinase